MFFGVLTFGQGSFGSAGVAAATNVEVTLPTNIATLSLGTVQAQGNVDVAVSGLQLTSSLGAVSLASTANVTISGLQLTSNIGTTTVQISKSVDAPSLIATFQSIGTLTFIGDANVVFSNVIARYDTNTYDNANSIYAEESFTPLLETSLGTVTVQSDANITVSGFALTLSNNLNAITTVGNANVTPSSNLLNLSLGTLSIEGTGNVVLPSLQLTSTFNSPGVVGNAVVNIDGFLLQLSNQLNDAIVTTINQNDYAKDRTVFVPYRKHNLNSSNNVSSQQRIIVIPTRQHIVKSTNIVDDKNRTIIIPPRNHTVQTTKIAA